MNNLPAVKKHTSHTALTYTICAAVLALVGAGANIYLMRTYYEADLYLYKSSSALPGVFHIAVAVCTLLLMTSAFAIKKDSITEVLPKPSSFTVFTASMLGFISAASALMLVYEFVRGSFRLGTASSVFAVATAVFAIPSAIYFFTVAISVKPNVKYLVSCGYFVILWSAFALISEYFDMSVPLNSPPHILNQISYLTLMLYMLYELRCHLGVPRPKRHIAFGCAAILILGINSISVISMTGIAAMTSKTVMAFAEFAAALYIFSRMLSLYFAPFEKLPEIPDSEAQNENPDAANENQDKIQ